MISTTISGSRFIAALRELAGYLDILFTRAVIRSGSKFLDLMWAIACLWVMTFSMGVDIF